MRRIVVLGAGGFFGSAVAKALIESGHEPETPARTQVDVEAPASLAGWLRAGDVVVDAAGPFQGRTTALVEAAVAIGFDVIDLSDSLDYALLVRGLEKRIRLAGVRVFSSCSAVSAVSATLIRVSQIDEPARVSVCLVPASRETTTPGTVQSLLQSVGRPVRMLRDGHLVAVEGWRQSRRFRFPLRPGGVHAFMTESADAVNLPAIWPSLRQVDFWVDTNVAGVNTLLALAARLPVARGWLRAFGLAGRPLAKLIGTPGGGFVVEVESAGGKQAVFALAARHMSFMVAVMPALLVARNLAAERPLAIGLVPQHQHVDPDELLEQLAQSEIEMVKSWP